MARQDAIGLTGVPQQEVRAIQVHRDQPPRDVPFVPTDEAVVAAMLKLAELSESDLMYDLGCGDGRIVIAAAKRGARGVGVDIDLQRIHECAENAKAAGVTRRVKFLRQSFFDADLRDATVVTLYLLPGINVKLRPKLLWELRPGTRIVSNNFEMGDWPPDATESIHHRMLYRWIVPAWVQGDWRCVINMPRQRRHMQLRLRRHYQVISGTARLGEHEIVVTDGRIKGDRLTFTLWHAEHLRPPIHFSAVVDGQHLRGTCESDGDPPIAWGGSRTTSLTDPRLH